MLTVKQKMLKIEERFGNGMKAAKAARVSPVTWSRWRNGNFTENKSRCPAIVDFLYNEVVRQSA